MDDLSPQQRTNLYYYMYKNMSVVIICYFHDNCKTYFFYEINVKSCINLHMQSMKNTVSGFDSRY